MRSRLQSELRQEIILKCLRPMLSDECVECNFYGMEARYILKAEILRRRFGDIPFRGTTCKNPRCVNPRHAVPVMSKELKKKFNAVSSLRNYIINKAVEESCDKSFYKLSDTEILDLTKKIMNDLP
jgi:hypothetical protein